MTFRIIYSEGVAAHKGQGDLQSKEHSEQPLSSPAQGTGGGLCWHQYAPTTLVRMFHELVSRDHEDGRATGQPQGVGPEAYLNGTSQGPTPEDARKNVHIRGCSKQFMKHPG